MYHVYRKHGPMYLNSSLIRFGNQSSVLYIRLASIGFRCVWVHVLVKKLNYDSDDYCMQIPVIYSVKFFINQKFTFEYTCIILHASLYALCTLDKENRYPSCETKLNFTCTL